MDEQLFILRPASGCMPASTTLETIVDHTWYNMLVPFAIPGFTGHGFSLMTRLTLSCRCRMQFWLSGKMQSR